MKFCEALCRITKTMQQKVVPAKDWNSN